MGMRWKLWKSMWTDVEADVGKQLGRWVQNILRFFLYVSTGKRFKKATAVLQSWGNKDMNQGFGGRIRKSGSKAGDVEVEECSCCYLMDVGLEGEWLVKNEFEASDLWRGGWMCDHQQRVWNPWRKGGGFYHFRYIASEFEEFGCHLDFFTERQAVRLELGAVMIVFADRHSCMSLA